ncbi:uncharacterized protein J8A68_001929 [[Candida] subhashii]|uniref:Uncharacterized protein n=1 Tax=[Candida] subhashii TaxID=561895 RepID=A0A8J5QK41_9ASCO|nr:uncharacterized protein J8A68_001929 [[Candida] subhashii]KAG7664542.1 hypothetical protein J8A68_001929 [[Candida] subhashii]
MSLSSVLISNWYIVFTVVIISHIVGKRLYAKHLMKKFGAQPCTNIDYDGYLGFKLGLKALRTKREGRAVEFNIARFKAMPHPEVPTFTTYIFGFPVIQTKDPENIKAILATQFEDFSLGLRFKFFKPVLGLGIFTVDGEAWKHSRAMLRPQFTRDQISRIKSLEPHFINLKKHIDKNKGQFFDIQELFFRFTVDSATEFLFGESVSSLCDEAIGYNSEQFDFDCRKEFPEAFNKSQVYLATRSILQRLYWLVDNSEFRECTRIVHKFADHYVQKALAATKEELEKESDKYTFLYELVKQTRNPTVLRDESLNILVAGRDTTAGLLAFAIFEMARNPDMWAKLREEILTNFQNNLEDITFENLKKCEYLKAVLNETLRMYPSVPRNGRIATRDTTLPRGGGPDGQSPILVRKGQAVGYVINATHVDETYYGKDAGIYRPERWFESQVRKLGWAFLPFNGGPRICLGQQFALTEASYVMTMLALNYEHLSLEPSSEYPPKKLLHLTMCLDDGVNIKME